ncbi:MAG: glycerophosphodiester phosphodiesterase, partial [Pseudomonadota bacterium]
LAPENTLASFRYAYQCGVSAVELDVHEVDGELVVIHDHTLDRTTNGSGRISGYCLKRLRTLDAGAGSRIPLLAEVVAELPGDIGLNIELKGRGTAAPTASFLAARQPLDVLVSSFDLDELTTFRRLAPNVRVAPLFQRWRGQGWGSAARLHAWAINLSSRTATPRILQQAARRGYRVFVYTINDAAEARRLVTQGATGIFTDYPDRIVPAVRTLAVRS